MGRPFRAARAAVRRRHCHRGGPTLGPKNTGICIFEAPDEDAAQRIMAEDPVVSGGYAAGELRPFKLSMLRGRD